MNQLKDNQPGSKKTAAFLWIAAVALAFGLLFARAVYPELLWASIVVGVALVGALGLLIQQNAKALRGRTAAYGLNSAITVLLVLGIVGTLNFLSYSHPGKLDLTQNKTHTLSDQSAKLLKGLPKTVKAVLFAKVQQREQFKPLLEDYRELNPGKFELEYVDPDKEPTRAKQSGIKKYGTLQLLAGTRDLKIEEPNEEKLTNALIKITRDKTPTLCAITGHGEKSFAASDAEGYDAVKKQLVAQSYEVKDLNLVQEAKIPDSCDAIAIIGPTKSYFDPEVKLLREYLEQGGRAIVAIDVNVGRTGTPGEYAPELIQVLGAWGIKSPVAMIVDPLSRMMNVDASVSLIASFSKEHPITKETQGQAYFPFMRSLEIEKSSDPGIKIDWLGQTTPKSWAVTDLKQLSTGKVTFTEGKDRAGPFNGMVAVSGKRKDSKAKRETRLVVFGTSAFANNNSTRFGGNGDLFLNSVAWVVEDESMISIHAKEEGPGKIELSQKQGTIIFLVTVIAIPLLTAIAGIVIWALRRRL